MKSAYCLRLQALLSLIDLQYHGPILPADRGGSSSTWQHVAQQYSSLPAPPDTCPQARFSHLTIYGACYYSYLYARCIAEALWDLHFATNPLNPEAGGCNKTSWLHKPVGWAVSSCWVLPELQHTGIDS